MGFEVIAADWRPVRGWDRLKPNHDPKFDKREEMMDGCVCNLKIITEGETHI